MGGENKNHLCSCGSLKQIKFCYGKAEYENNCLEFLRENKEKYLNTIQSYQDNIVSEVRASLDLLLPNDSTTRSRCILVFSMLDTITNFWRVFSDIRNPEGPSKKVSDTYIWKNWFEYFISNTSNTEWHEWINLYPGLVLNGGDLYTMRCSLSHFFGLGESKISLISFGNPPKMDELGKNGIPFLDPQTLFMVVSRGSILMIDYINNEFIIDELQGLLKIQKLYKEIDSNGISIVSLSRECD